MKAAATLLIAKKGFDSRIDIDNEFAVEALIFPAFALLAVKPLLNRFFLLSEIYKLNKVNGFS